MLLANGRLNGVLTTAAGPRQVKNVRLALPVDLDESGFREEQMAAIAAGEEVQATALQACNVLTLVLGPLDLNLLGLEIRLEQIELVIDANPAGGLLGQLLALLCGSSLGEILDVLLGNLGGLAGLLNLILFLLAL